MRMVRKTNKLWILAVLLVVAGGTWGVLFETNLMPDQKAAVTKFVQKLLATGRKGLIRGIVSGEDGFTALIDDQAVREGENIYGATVVKIYPDEVEFEKEGTRWTQKLNEVPGRQWQGGARVKEQAQTKTETEIQAKAQQEVQARAKAEAEAKAQEEARAKEQAEAKAQAEAEAKAQEEAIAKAKEQAEAGAKAETEAKAQEEAIAKAKEQAEAEAGAKAEVEAKAQEEAQAKAKQEAEAQAQAEAEAQAKARQEAEAKEQAEAQEEAIAKAQEQAEAEARAKAEVEAKAQEEAIAKAKEQAEAQARAKEEELARAREQAEAEAMAQAEAQADVNAAGSSLSNKPDARTPSPSQVDDDTQQTIAVLISRLGDREPSVRDSVVATLQRIGPPAVEPLIAAMQDEDWIIRQGASQALGRIGDPKAVEPLIGALEDKNQWIRRYAAEALGLIGDERAVEPLVAAKKDDDPGVQAAAAKALESIRGWSDASSRPDKSNGSTSAIMTRLLDFKMYIGAAIAALLLLAGLAMVLFRSQKST